MVNTKISVPVAPSERIISLDVLRGFAILGILIMNIQSFSMIEAAYINPAAYGSLLGLNKWVWILSHILADRKFMSIFSILFGAGIVLFTSKAESKGLPSAGLHYRRSFYLFIIGMMHAYLLWYGDILVAYSICAISAYLFRRIIPKKLLIIGILIFSVSSLLYFFFGWSMPYWPKESLQGTMSFWNPGIEKVNAEISAYQGGWLPQMSHRIPASISFQTFIFFILTGWRAGGLMLVGMALYKWGILSAKCSKRFYYTLMSIGFVIGIPIIAYGIVRNFAENWSIKYSMFLGWQYNYWGSLFITLGYICLIMLICKSEVLEKLTRPFAAVGRMALTNYLMQTVICTLIFYGHGFGLFGKVERTQQILFVFGIWVFQIIVSPIWLRYFRFGPAEWLWRTLSYQKIQPMVNRK
ncbi:DUF418 domain-containing protein [candidate division WOR-3 bacterium]|nr:DUF418 domain-containing protein [candidate division WOR-3 bacterium]